MTASNVKFSRSELGKVEPIQVLHVDDDEGFEVHSRNVGVAGGFQLGAYCSVRKALEKPS